VGMRCADNETPFYLQKLALTFPTSGGRLFGVVRLRNKNLAVTAVSMKNVLWDVTPCGSCKKGRIGGTYCPYLHGEKGLGIRKSAITSCDEIVIILTAC
jgi:hypothetical protein